ncbi:recombinase family protein [Herbiconiux sp. SYSU D00978]|uniref:recombinase family protein n=1 Tax=Herbiconiux sp. SYSU D00978 TaxID=2812562 RepID=UPI001A9594BF|nr:recombinase family protein [Herbiconiux sp. SYSU D00978]
MTTRVAIYGRQSAKVAEGIAQQAEACRRYVAEHGWHLVDEYLDNATSATKRRGEQSQWARMLRDVDAGRIDAVVAVAVDRLLRRVVDVIELTSRGVRIVITRQGLDTNEAMGKALLTILAAIAEAEIENKEERNLPYRAARREAGHPPAGKVPYGYRWVPRSERDETGTRYAVVPEEAEVVRFIFREWNAVDKPSLGAIARELNARGIRTRAGADWGKSTVRRLLLSPYHAGLLPESQGPGSGTYRAEAVDLSRCQRGSWEAVVSEDELRAAREKLLDPSRLTHAGNARKWLLSGLATCSVCGVPVRSAVTKDGHRAYRCRVGHFQRMGGLIDEYVESVVKWRLTMPEVRAQLDQPRGDVDVPALRLHMRSIRGRRLELLKLLDHGYTADDISQKRAEYDAELADAELTLARVRSSDPLAEIVSAANIEEHWGTLSLARKRSILTSLGTAIQIGPSGKGKRFTTQSLRYSTEGFNVLVGFRLNGDVLQDVEAALTLDHDQLELANRALA